MSSRLIRVLTYAFAAGTVRQAFILFAIVRSGRFLRQSAQLSASGQGRRPVFWIVLPVLREAALLRDTVDHMQKLADGHDVAIAVVTTVREAAEAHRHDPAVSTIDLARDLADQGRCIHFHYPDPEGVKADQLNFAAASCAAMLPPKVTAADVFLVCYDADSRPPPDSLDHFAQAIAVQPDADVFHQSSRFELRTRRPRRALPGITGRIICDAGALRANRFVLGFELPRLVNRSAQAGRVKRATCSAVYAHVTGHGLCVRLSLLEQLPFPAGSPLEDMHYSFILGSRGLPMVPVPSLDCAEVPGSVAGQLSQAARWFFGPGRFARYMNDPGTWRGPRAWLMAASAFGSAVEWTGCALVPPLAAAALCAARNKNLRAAAAAFTLTCGVQAVLTETFLGAEDPFQDRLARVLGFPLACMVHGAGGITGAARLLAGGTGTGKTERSASR
jgi:cellulose synthase/poly-beta-1,6-N-acetylglucosamine synthase-like glycosyltransferase